MFSFPAECCDSDAAMPIEPGIILLLGSFYRQYGTKVGLPFARERVTGRWYDPDISTPEGQVAFRAAGVPPFALCIALGYALRAGCRFYCTLQDLEHQTATKVE